MVSTLFSGLNDAVIARVVLLANHVIASEPVAVQKLKPYAGRTIELRLLTKSSNSLLTTLSGWLPDQVLLQITPAGLLEWTPEPIAPPATPGGLTVTVDVPDPLTALKLAFQRERPAVSIDGDAGLAEAVSWLMKNLRWDLEDDLARWLGTPPTQVLKAVSEAVKDTLSRFRPGAPGQRRPSAR
jgi:ubiquinone biosynthesis protein UbiJ